MTTIGKNQIYSKLELLEEYLKYLKEIVKETKEEKIFVTDFHFFGLAERYLQLSIQVLIDTIQMIIIEEGFARPDDNQEAISLLHEQKILSKKLVLKLDGIVGFRNILVHEYGKVDHKRVYDYLQNELDTLQQFKKEIVKYLA